MAKYDEVTFEIREHIGVIEARKDGWNKEVNIVAWNGGVPKVDIRDWDPGHERMTRGITLLEEDAKKLFESYKNWREEKSIEDVKGASLHSIGGDPNEVSVDINEYIRSLEERGDGWKKELNVVTWNKGATKYDIRDWSPDHNKMTRGITLTEDVADKLSSLLNERYKEA